MKTIFELCAPRDDILKGELREELFAARLRDVIEGSAERIYGDPVLFFENTYPTDGLRTLITEALGRLTGSDPGRNALIRLETSFGGGKTHGLIALYHLASGNLPPIEYLKWLGGEVAFPKPGEVQVAGVVGSDLDPSVGMDHPKDGIRTKTLWGEIAYQLAGPEGYAIAQENDELLAAPGAALFERLEGLHEGKATLIMIDEIARHLRSGAAYPTKTGKSTLAEQTVAFLMSLVEYAASRPNVVVVLTLAGEEDAFAKESASLRQQLAESKAVSARQERVIRPSDEGEMPAIVVHRLFKSIDRKAAKVVVDRYQKYYGELFDRNTDLPPRVIRAEYGKEFLSSYPFHPELLLTLDRKVSTIPNFHRTRGALRLLARTVRSLWQRKPANTYAIHIHHLDLADSSLVEDLTARLDRPRFKQVIDADIVSELAGSRAHAQEIDTDYPAPYARRLGTTIFLHSLSQAIATGLTQSELNVAVLAPTEQGGDDPAVVHRALERLHKKAWFMEYDGHRYRFKTEPSLNKIVEDEKAQVGTTMGKTEIDRRIRKIWRKGYLAPCYFPDAPADVDDDAGPPKLVILHYDAVSLEASDLEPPELARRIMRFKGSDESFRQYQNNLVFLVADKDQVDHMVDQSRRYLAIHRILGDSDRLAAFNEEQVKDLRKMAEAAELEVRVAITRAYRYLYYPTADAPKSSDFLRRETLPAQDQGEVDQDQTNVVLRVLRALNKVLTTDDQILSAQFVRSKSWGRDQTYMSTEELRRTFARGVGLRMLLDVGQLKRTIRNGVENGIWVYYDSREDFAYDADSPMPAYEISEETILYLPEEAQRRGLRIKGKWKENGELEGKGEVVTCPVCGNPEDQCTCGRPSGDGTPAKVQEEGAPAKAFQRILDQCHDHRITHLKEIYVSIEGSGAAAGNDLRALALIVPQLGKGSYSLELALVTTFGEAPNDEVFELKYEGGWERYKRFRAMVDDMTKEASSQQVRARLRIVGDEPIDVDGDRLSTLKELFSALEIDSIRVEAVPMTEGARSA
jgi:hypothetical protein